MFNSLARTLLMSVLKSHFLISPYCYAKLKYAKSHENLFLLTFQGTRASSCHEFVSKAVINREGACDARNLGLHSAEESRCHGYSSIDNDITPPATVSTGIARFKVKYCFSIDPLCPRPPARPKPKFEQNFLPKEENLYNSTRKSYFP